jgi:branched-subunit amino acid aminotransferase/4-amino-4-deoxychorismate lyase
MAGARSSILWVAASHAPRGQDGITGDPVRAVRVSFHRGETAPFRTTGKPACLLARLKAASAGVEEGIFTDGDALLESTSSNLFAVLEGALVTSPVSLPVLPGVTRALVLGLARQLGVPCRERALLPADLFHAEEIFLTDAVHGLRPLVSLDGHHLGRTKAVSNRLRQAYSEVYYSPPA